jgi:hypothetical protein
MKLKFLLLMVPKNIFVYLDHDLLVVNSDYNWMILIDWLFVHSISMNEIITKTKIKYIRVHSFFD